ncbi:PH domain-containing protein [Actinokineospora bangkokensis]|uniref:Low molecular weight protein antigen 6 PH domain-containing protein n=1 Tax=Actinokineospora bangkokensis TaxID=1193682 RepID=A0A1Q9LTV4_9PSEU|nr:PH domain-containing protein [Actinokineospora bangkokensis]OLR95472.1 hypothetical protein BJP25_06965 [Actinokineospora bangkokensis]
MDDQPAVERSAEPPRLPYELHPRWRWWGVGLGLLVLLVSLSLIGLDDVLGFALAGVFIVFSFVLIDTFYNSGVRLTDDGVEERSVLVRSRVVDWDDIVDVEVPAGRVLRRPVLLTGDGERLSLYSMAFLSLGRDTEPRRVRKLRATVDEMAWEYYDEDTAGEETEGGETDPGETGGDEPGSGPVDHVEEPADKIADESDIPERESEGSSDRAPESEPVAEKQHSESAK